MCGKVVGGCFLFVCSVFAAVHCGNESVIPVNP